MGFNVPAGLVFAVAALCCAGAGQPRGGGSGGGGDPRTLGGQLKANDSRYYVIYTDVDEESTREAVLRMTKMAEEYNERTRALFRGQIGKKLPFYLYASGADYYKAGGMQGSAGVFNGEALMAMAIPMRGRRVGPGTWHVVQHEGFHQFVKSVIRGDIPIWANEGLAEYFGEAVFTGDGMVAGVIPPARLARVKARLRNNGFKGIEQMMELSHADWNAAVNGAGDGKAGANYDMAWAMVHFLAHGENGKYQDAFANFLVLMGNGHQWKRAWTKTFGSVEGFEEKWKAYWSGLPENPTAELYAQATVTTLTGFLGRAASQKQAFASFEEFVATDPKALKAAQADWLPASLFTDAKGMAEAMRVQGSSFALVQPKGSPASVVCTMADGVKVTGRYAANGTRIGKVTVEVIKAPAAKPAASKPVAPPAAKPKQ